MNEGVPARYRATLGGFLRFSAALLIVLLSVGALTLTWRVWRALPQTSGRIVVTGIAAPIEVLRDGAGVPHIRAANEADAQFGLGYAHAQDRLWQMEVHRRLGRGRLSEILGSEAVATDIFFRTLGLARLATEIWGQTSGETRASVEAYVRGVNAFLAGRRGSRLPLEYAALGFEPEPWTPEDSIIWGKVVALQLDTNYRDELLRARLVARIGQDGAAALMPAYTAGGPVILPEGMPPASTPPGSLIRAVPTSSASNDPIDANEPGLNSEQLEALFSAARLPPRTAGAGSGGSNSWVVSGTQTVTGKPLLANDPHLGASSPSVWYLAHLQGGPLNVIGATLPGVPGVIIGHNGRIAWGITAAMADVQDLFVERIQENQAAEFDGRLEPLAIVHETIKVRGAPDVQLAARSTRNGPLVSDVLSQPPTALALRWTALAADDHVLESQRALSLAKNWDEFTVAASKFTTPAVSFVYADADGNIGYFSPGRLPRRGHGNGTLPVPGWTGEHAWVGTVPTEELPRIYNPTHGMLVAANNPPLPDAHPPLVGSNWEPGYRAGRILALLDASPRVSVDDMARIQADVRSTEVDVLLPWMRRARPIDDESRAALDLLRTWSGALEAGSPEAALFMAWTEAATIALFEDELGGALFAEWAQWPHWRSKALDLVVTSGQDRWCDDVRTSRSESCEEILGVALRSALNRAAVVQGNTNLQRWRWDRANVAVFAHRPFEAVWYLRPFFSARANAGGNANTVNPVATTPLGSLVASYRQIVDLANFDNSRFIHPLGQSGQPGSAHASDLQEAWREVQYVPMHFSRAAVDRATVERLVLDPAGSTQEPSR